MTIELSNEDVKDIIFDWFYKMMPSQAYEVTLEVDKKISAKIKTVKAKPDGSQA